MPSIRIRPAHRRRSRFSTFLVVTRRTFAVVVIAVTATAGVGVASAAPSEPRAAVAVADAGPYNNSALVAELAKHAEGLDAVDEVLGADAPTTAELIELHDVATDAVDAARTVAGTDGTIRLAVFGSVMSDDEIDAAEAAVVYEMSEATTYAAAAAAEDWKAEVEVENARITAAAARVADAARAAQGYGGSLWSSASGSESFEQRVAHMAASLPFHVSYSIENGCDSAGALACFRPRSNQILVTTYLSSHSDCTIRIALAHEFRHSQQSRNGQIEYSGGTITNREWLESDAYSFGARYGC